MVAIEFCCYDPSGLVFSVNADSLMIPCASGETEILPDHARVYSLINYGIVSVFSSLCTYVLVTNGIIEVDGNNKVVIHGEYVIPFDASSIDKLKTICKNERDQSKRQVIEAFLAAR